MISVYKIKADIPPDRELIEWNDYYFNRNTADLIGESAALVLSRIDGADLLTQYTIRSSFNGDTLNIDKLSSGCKTILNIIYNPDKVFSIKECGDNAIDYIYSLDNGSVYSDYPVISFNAVRVNVCDSKGVKEIDGYEELKEWWEDEK